MRMFAAWCLWLVATTATVAADGWINYTDYWRMPRVFEFDDYDECLLENPDRPSVYCVVTAAVRPDDRAPIWRLIERYSENWKQQLNHAHLDRGICVRNCEAFLATVNATDDLLVAPFPTNYPFTFLPDTFRDEDTYRRQYGELLEKCINAKLFNQSGVKARTIIEYCDTNASSYPIDTLEILFLVALVTLAVIVTLSSWYDASCNTANVLEHYKVELTSTASSLLACFSIIRNWYRLTSRDGDDLNRDIRYIHSIRLVTFLGVTLAHTMIFAPQRSSLTIEEKYHDIGTMFMLNASQTVTTFFAISGMMLMLFFFAKAKETKRKMGPMEILVTLAVRYVRLTPVYAFVILFEATWLYRLGDGPLWRKGIESGRTYCRRNWWVNLLYLNNYYRADQPCMLHTWYLAADFHLFFYGLILCTLFIRFPKLKVIIMGVAMLASYVVTALVVYIKEYHAFTLFPPEGLRFFFWYWKEYLDTYIPTHMYLVNYTFALCSTFWYMRLLRTRPKFHWTIKTVWILVAMLPLAMFASGYVFYFYDFKTPSIWMSLMFPLMRLLYSCAMFVAGIVFSLRFLKGLVRLADLPLFTTIGRLSYSAYLCHLCILKAGLFSSRSFYHTGLAEVSMMFFGTVCISYLVAWLLCLSLESPVVALQKILFLKFMRKQAQASQTMAIVSRGPNKC